MDNSKRTNEEFLNDLIKTQKLLNSMILSVQANLSKEWLIDLKLKGDKFIRPIRNPYYLRIYGHPYCPYVERVRITLNEKNIPYQFCQIDFPSRPKWFQELGSDNKSPILELKNADDILYESEPISYYIDKIEKGSRTILPSDPIDVCKTQILIKKQNDFISEFYKLFKNSEDQEIYTNIKKILRFLDNFLSKNSENSFFFNNKLLGFADIFFIPHIRRVILLKDSAYNNCYKNIEIESFTNIMKWYSKIFVIDAVQKVLISENAFHKVMADYKEKKTFSLTLDD